MSRVNGILIGWCEQDAGICAQIAGAILVRCRTGGEQACCCGSTNEMQGKSHDSISISVCNRTGFFFNAKILPEKFLK